MAYLLNGSKQVASSKLVNVFERDHQKGEELVHELCDQLLDPSKFGERSDTIEWLKALISGDEDFTKFCTRVKNMDSSPLCGCVWTANFVAYRCRTCAASPCMSLCAACFERGNHDGHDYNIFRSEAGGACDCGDPSVMKKSGFCSHHGPNRVPPELAPPGFLSAGKVMLDRIILAMVHILRKFSSHASLHETFIVNFTTEIEEFFAFILELVKLGSPIRTHLTQLLLNEKLYQGLMRYKGYKSIENPDTSIRNYHKNSISWFLHSVAKGAVTKIKFLFQCVKQPIIPPDIPDRGQFKRSEEYKNYVDEITFWIVRYEFPEPVILIILNLLPDPDMKREFSKAFARHYSRIATSLANSTKVDQLSTRVVHISVQLFSNDDLAYMLAVEEHLLQIFVVSTYNIIDPSLQASNTTEKDFHQCVFFVGTDPGTNAYWPIVSDFVNVLSHPRVAMMFLADNNLVSSWVQQLTCFSGMNLIRRAISSHIEYEPSNALIAFYTEREACASPLWTMLDVLQDRESSNLSINVIRILLDALTEFFDALGFEGKPPLPYDQISFHYPLHRYLAHFLCNAIKNQAVEISDIGVDHDEAVKLMAHPLQVLACMHEIQVGMWVRNGAYISTQALAYKQYFFCSFFFDADLYLLQFCASIISPDLFIASIFERCRVTNHLTVSDHNPSSSDSSPDEDRAPKMMEAAFNILLSVLGIQIHLGLPDDEVIRSETVVLLSSQSCTYSKLSDHIPQCHESHSGLRSRHYMSLFSDCLSQLAVKKEEHYNKGEAMDQTTYILNNTAWKYYDPVFTEHRTLYKKVVQQASNHLRDNSLIPQQGITESTIWPPYIPISEPPHSYKGLTRILHCRTTHAFIYVILYKALHDHAAVTETTLAMALHVLEAALSLRNNHTEDVHGLSSPDLKRSKVEDSWHKLFHSWFESEDILINIRKTIDMVQAPLWKKMDTSHDMDVSQEQNNENSGNSQTTGQSATFVATGMTKIYVIYTKLEFIKHWLKKPKLQKNFHSFVILTQKKTLFLKGKESMLSMLIKLHDKFHGNAGSFHLDINKLFGRERTTVIPSTPTNVISNVLHVAASKSSELQMTIQVIMKSLSPSTSSSTSPMNSQDGGGPSVDYEKIKRRKQAREARIRMMQQLAEKQKQFMELGLQVLEPPFNTSPLSDDTEPPAKYECVICGTVETEMEAPSVVNAPNREQKLMGIICLAQATSVLGEILLFIATKGRIVLWLTVIALIDQNTSPVHLFFKNKIFAETETADIAVGAHISTCGHHVHFSCHRDYTDSVSQHESSQISRDMPHGFQCPMCRQVSNIILPCNIRYRRTSELRPDVPSDTNIVNACSTTATTISLTIQTTLHVIMMVRLNLEQHLLQLGNTLLASSTSYGSPRGANSCIQRKLPIVQRINIGLHKSSTSKTIKDLLSNLEFPTSGLNSKQELPLLLQDPISLLIKIFKLYACPVTRQPYFLSHVQLLYNLAYVQSLIQVCTQFSHDERRAWKSNGLVIQTLDAKTFKTDESHLFSSSGLGYLNTVFSPQVCVDYHNPKPQSVVTNVEQSLLSYLRIAALLQSHIFSQHPIPIQSESGNEFLELVKILGDLTSLFEGKDSVSATKCLKWRSPRSVITRWCDALNNFVRTDVVISRQLINARKEWFPPKLVELPHEYSVLFQRYRQVECDKCKTIPKDPALCLVCGSYICYKSKCKRLRQDNAASRHSKTCGAGTCILLLINSSIVVVIRGSRACIWGTLYLDAHGEEDKGWKRGKPLFLKRERLELLERQWIQHSFDNSCKNWAAHRQTL
uniref:E3 ubiquitin-protein ligase n=1 Tax=Ciona intestinalis TaxID=7719 RepID=F6RPY5_CIOIN